MISIQFNSLNKNLSFLITSYLIVLGIGVTLGLTYVYLTSEFTSNGMIEQYLGNDDEWEPKLAKTFIDLVSHAHEHITMFSMIFLSLGFIFSNNSVIKGFWKSFLIIEPFLSIIITFGGFFIIRYISIQFSYIIIHRTTT